MIEHIFSTPVYRDKFLFNDNELDFIISQEKKNNQYSNQTSVSQFILNSIELKNLKEQVQYHFKKYEEDILSLDGSSLVLTQSWANYNKNGSSHHTHRHPNSIVSSVLYFTDSPSDLVMFREFNETLEPNIKNFNMYNSLSHSIKLSKNDIVLFPSTLMHGVKVNNDDQERISLAVNSFYSGVLGVETDSTYLKVTTNV
jgi:uncharacterized protein (TIGR02466 family)